MTREETKKCIEVMKHFEDGGEIEVIDRFDENDKWQKTSRPVWNWAHEIYRIKPQLMKATEEEKSYTKGRMWFKNRHTDEMLFVKPWMINKDHFYILNSETMEWEEWSENAEILKHHYNGGQS